MTDAVTLDNCAAEPIHIPGAIQPHGVLLACRGPELTVRQVSANVSELLGRAPKQLLGTPVTELFDGESAARVLAATRDRGSMRENNPQRVRVAGRLYDAVLHEALGEALVLELEPVSDAAADINGPAFDPRLRASVRRLERASSVAELCKLAAVEVRALTSFDRVMVYRFDEEWNGEVVAEDRRADLEPFLGLHYPASDIPAQARKLYTLNWLRLIADADYTPSALVPALDPDTRAPLDLTYSVLRSVSPIHIAYLKNMGVTASMSISLIIDGALVGLIACHHYSGPWLVPYRVRDTAEYLGQALSWHLRVLESSDAALRARTAQAHEAAIVRSLVTVPDLLDGLGVPELIALTESAGAAVVLQEGTRRIGACPSSAEVASVVAWLSEREYEVFSTHHLAAHMGEAAPAAASGLLAVAIARELGEYLLWFRPASEQTVDWAGDPRKIIVTPSPGAAPRLSPRGSFELWRETVRGQSVRFKPWHLEAASNLRRVLLGGVRLRAAELRELNDRLQQADRAKDTFIATVGHELRTPLNAIVGWARLLRSGAVDEEKRAHALDVISRNADAQAEIIEDLLDVSRMVSGKLTLQVAPVDLPQLVASVLDAQSVALSSKELRLKRVLDPDAAPVLGDETRLRQVVSNLISNAIKFTPKGGSINVALRRAESDAELLISDSGQGIPADFLPHVFEAFRQADGASTRRAHGLGLGLAIVRQLVELHGGRVSVESQGTGSGSTFRVRLPVSPVYTSQDRRTPDVPAPSDALQGLAVLVVEDEADSRELLAMVLTQRGAAVHAAGDVDSALALLGTHAFDLIVSDIGLPDRDGFELLRNVRALPGTVGRTPAVALTAYARTIDRTAALQAGFNAHVRKPVDTQELLAVMASLTRRHSS